MPEKQQTLEELLDTLDKWINLQFSDLDHPENEKKITAKVGLFLRFSVTKNKWICGYAVNNKRLKLCGIGDTPREAVLNKVKMGY